MSSELVFIIVHSRHTENILPKFSLLAQQRDFAVIHTGTDGSMKL